MAPMHNKLEAIARAQPCSSPSLTPAHRGRLILEELNRPRDLRTVWFGVGSVLEGLPVVPSAEIRQLSRERELVQHLSPYLQAVFPDRVLVNSESKPWLVVDPQRTKFHEKPDVFFCHAACYTSQDKPSWCQDEPLDRAFGVLTSMRLAEDAFIGDCKCGIQPAAFGEILHHLHRLAASIKCLARGFLFDWHECWLLEVDPHGSVVQRVIMQWDQVSYSHA